jgi:hypothetical protein
LDLILIVLRAEFLSDHHAGAIKFVNVNWSKIREAAGWGALRVWVLVSEVNRALRLN